MDMVAPIVLFVVITAFLKQYATFLSCNSHYLREGGMNIFTDIE